MSTLSELVWKGTPSAIDEKPQTGASAHRVNHIYHLSNTLWKSFAGMLPRILLSSQMIVLLGSLSGDGRKKRKVEPCLSCTCIWQLITTQPLTHKLAELHGLLLWRSFHKLALFGRMRLILFATTDQSVSHKAVLSRLFQEIKLANDTTMITKPYTCSSRPFLKVENWLYIILNFGVPFPGPGLETQGFVSGDVRERFWLFPNVLYFNMSDSLPLL